MTTITFTGCSAFSKATTMAKEAGDKHAARHNRSHWNLDDFDVAEEMFHAVLDCEEDKTK